jgi:hypothetical protein
MSPIHYYVIGCPNPYWSVGVIVIRTTTLCGIVRQSSNAGCNAIMVLLGIAVNGFSPLLVI